MILWEIQVKNGAPTRQNRIYYLKYYQLLKRLGIFKSGLESGPPASDIAILIFPINKLLSLSINDPKPNWQTSGSLLTQFVPSTNYPLLISICRSYP